MLVLGMKPGDVVYIGKARVVVERYAPDNGKVKLCIDAPRDVVIDRGVVRESKEKESAYVRVP